MDRLHGARFGPGRQSDFRALLVPATMRLLGRANWWLPRPLARLHDRLGFDEGAEAPEVEPPATIEREPELVGSRG